jgi:DNA-binding winged helix-turn-helix (wHTH) protein
VDEGPNPLSGRYIFGPFVLSSCRRLLLRDGHEVSIAPRCFDLLLLLIRRRSEAIGRREILDAVWSDVVVSDGSLSQAIRTLRRALGDDPRRSEYIRTVSRHGYQFVFPRVIEGDDTEPLPLAERKPEASPGGAPRDFDVAFAELVSDAPEEARRSAAERVHGLSTAEAVARLRVFSGGAKARALLRDARWDLPQAGRVPIFGQPDALRTMWALFSLRLRRVLRAAGSRYATGVAGGAAAGLVAGFVGGLFLYLGPASRASASVTILLALIGGAIAAMGAVGVAAGLCSAEVLVRSRRGLALVLFGAVGGGMVGVAAQGVGRLALLGLFGQDLSPVAGGLEGLVLGATTGMGYAVATPRPGGGMATPHGGARLLAALAAGTCCAVAAAVLSATGSYLGAMSLDLLANRFPGSQVGLEPLARLLGEESPGLKTRCAIGAWEGLMFASGTVLGMTRRPK